MKVLSTQFGTLANQNGTLSLINVRVTTVRLYFYALRFPISERVEDSWASPVLLPERSSVKQNMGRKHWWNDLDRTKAQCSEHSVPVRCFAWTCSGSNPVI
jgi:hypothetical protein